MGIDTHALNFITYAARKRALGRVATIGRQGLLVPRLTAQFGHHCEDFLTKCLGAVIVDSYDYSGYEGATHVVDLNKTLQPEKRYDTIIDCGCTEHIYNAPQALKNISLLCDDGGQIVHVLPANNFCGHGFWQFSPELFFSLYSAANGYRDTEIFMADLRNHRIWYEVKQPIEGERAEVTSKYPLYVMCRTVKSPHFSHENVQQSDYIFTWTSSNPDEGSASVGVEPLKQMVKRHYRFYGLALSLRNRIREYARKTQNPTSLSNRNRHLKARNLAELLGSQ